jgi:hypothetical protein
MFLEDVLYARGEQSVCGNYHYSISRVRKDVSRKGSKWTWNKFNVCHSRSHYSVSSVCSSFYFFCVDAEAEDESEDESESDGGSVDRTSCNPRMRPYNTGRNELSQQMEVLNGSDNSDNDENDGYPSGVIAGTEHLETHLRTLIFDRPQSFIVPDEPNAGPLVVYETKRTI